MTCSLILLFLFHGCFHSNCHLSVSLCCLELQEKSWYHVEKIPPSGCGKVRATIGVQLGWMVDQNWGYIVASSPYHPLLLWLVLMQVRRADRW